MAWLWLAKCLLTFIWPEIRSFLKCELSKWLSPVNEESALTLLTLWDPSSWLNSLPSDQLADQRPLPAGVRPPGDWPSDPIVGPPPAHDGTHWVHHNPPLEAAKRAAPSLGSKVDASWYSHQPGAGSGKVSGPLDQVCFESFEKIIHSHSHNEGLPQCGLQPPEMRPPSHDVHSLHDESPHQCPVGRSVALCCHAFLLQQEAQGNKSHLLGHPTSFSIPSLTSVCWPHLHFLTPHVILRVTWGSPGCASAQSHLELHRWWFNSIPSRDELFKQHMENVPCDPLPELLAELTAHASLPSHLIRRLPACTQRAIIGWWLGSRSLLDQLLDRNGQHSKGSFPLSESQFLSAHANGVLLAFFLLALSQPIIWCSCCARAHRQGGHRLPQAHTHLLVGGLGHHGNQLRPPFSISGGRQMQKSLSQLWRSSILRLQQAVPGAGLHPSQSFQLGHALAALCYGMHSAWSDNFGTGCFLLLLIHGHIAVRHQGAAPHPRLMDVRAAGHPSQPVPLAKEHTYPDTSHDVCGHQHVPPALTHQLSLLHGDGPPSPAFPQGRLYSLRPWPRLAYYSLPGTVGISRPLSKLRKLVSQAAGEAKWRVRRHAAARLAAQALLSSIKVQGQAIQGKPT